MSLPSLDQNGSKKSRVGNILKKIIGGIVTFFVLVFGLAMILTDDLPEAADTFFGKLASNDVQGAYNETTQQFKNTTSFEEFNGFVAGYELNKYESATWNQREVNNSEGQLKGNIILNGLGEKPLTLNLKKEGDTWKIQGINIGTSELAVAPEKGVPNDEETVKLVQDTLYSFAQSVEKKNFTKFHSEISELWKTDITADKFFEYFGGLKLAIPSEKVKTIKPIFSSAPYLKDNLLIVDGYIANSSGKIQFQLKYTYEHPNWKLFGIYVK